MKGIYRKTGFSSLDQVNGKKNKKMGERNSGKIKKVTHYQMQSVFLDLHKLARKDMFATIREI